METVACNLCGARDETTVLSGPDRLFKKGGLFNVVRCRQCGLVYVNPRPDPEELGAHYPEEYGAFLRMYARHHKPAGLMKAGADMIERRRMPQGMTPGRALEIGCGGAHYLVSLRDKGWEAMGIEMSEENSRYAREELGLDVRTGAAEAVLPEFPDNHFDLVAMWHVIEHLADPQAVLKEVRRVLKPGGRLMMELPNYAGVSRSMFRTYWMALDLPRHLYHFTPKTMAATLKHVGLEPTKVKGVPAALVMTMSMQLAWNDWRQTLGSGFVLSPALLIALFPFSALLANLNLSAHMSAEAVKPVAS